MTQKHYRDHSGKYLGAFSGDVSLPDGALECPAPPSAFHIWTNGEWQPPAPTKADVQVERDRRILAGSTCTVAGYPTPIRLAGDPQTSNNMQARVTNAILAQQQGVTDPIFAWRDEDNVVHNLTPAQFLDLFNQASMFVDQLYRKSWALIDNPPIPADYAEDKHWT